MVQKNVLQVYAASLLFVHGIGNCLFGAWNQQHERARERAGHLPLELIHTLLFTLFVPLLS